jgi:hypothetical protein
MWKQNLEITFKKNLHVSEICLFEFYRFEYNQFWKMCARLNFQVWDSSKTRYRKIEFLYRWVFSYFSWYHFECSVFVFTFESIFSDGYLDTAKFCWSASKQQEYGLPDCDAARECVSSLYEQHCRYLERRSWQNPSKAFDKGDKWRTWH